MSRRTKLFIALILVLIGGAALVKLFQARIATALFANMASERAGRDATTGLPDGLHVFLCGTGSPLPDPSRAGPCTVVIAGKRIFVVDAGEGSSRNIARAGIPMGRIEALFLTHFHSDHIDGLGPMMLMRWTGASATSPLPIHGPAGVDQVVAGFNQAYTLDNGYRIAHHGTAIVPPSGAGAQAFVFALPAVGQGDQVNLIDEGGVRVMAFRVDHGPVSPAVGYRFDYKGRSVVISGDTKPVTALVTAAKGADMLIHEALQPKLVGLITDALAKRGQSGTAQITRDILNYHTTPEQAADAAKAAGVKRLVLSHIVPVLPLRFGYPAFLGDAEVRFGGAVTVGEDGMMFTLPAGQSTIIDSTLF
jgi:ribonuclease Z